jgi:hypothetical protein
VHHASIAPLQQWVQMDVLELVCMPEGLDDHVVDHATPREVQGPLKPPILTYIRTFTLGE